MRKKRLIISIIVVCSIVLLFPIRTQRRDDGGTVEYRAIFYSVTFWHRLDDRYESGYYEGIEFNIFPCNFINQ